MEQPSTQGHYTVPTISISNPKDWFIFFRFTHQAKEYLRKYREGVNRIKDKVQKMAQAEQYPHEVLKQFCNDYSLHELRDYQWNQLEVCLSTDNPPFDD